MQVERLCRKFERIIEDNSDFHSGCEDQCFEQMDHSQQRISGQNGGSSALSQKTLTVISGFFRNPIFVGLLVGGIVALILLLMNSSIMA